MQEMSMAENYNVMLDLLIAAARIPTKRAVVAAASGSYRDVTYEALVADIERTSAGLFERGIGKGTRVLMLIPPSIEFVVLVYALFRLGAVPVFLDPGNNVQRLAQLVRDAEPEAILAVPLAMMLRAAFPDAFQSVRVAVVLGDGPPTPDTFTYESIRANTATMPPVAVLEADEPMAIVFTSGSTGTPKGVEYTPRMFRAILAPLRERYGIGEEAIDLVTFPINLLTTPPVGATLVLPEMDAAAPGKVDPARVVQAIVDQGCTSSLGSPVFWQRVAQHCEEQGIVLPTMKSLLLAGAPVSGALLRRLVSALPNARLFIPMGSTECGPLAAIEAREILSETLALTEAGHGLCVGRPFAGHDVRVIALTKGPLASWAEAVQLPIGEIGEIVVTGPGVSPRYFRDTEATRNAKMRSNVGEESERLWHRTFDTGYFDAQGRLWFTGRAAHILEHAGKRIYPVIVESMLTSEPDLLRAGLVQVRNELVLCVEFLPRRDPQDLALRIEQLVTKVKESGVALDRALVNHEGIPVDARHNAKIDYAALTLWATKQPT
jgi:acyl-CoA synthetase (AMP-forming)/AMP-acid ligase II